MNSKAPRHHSGLIASLVIVVVAIMAYSQSQAIVDWVRMRGYDPPAAVVSVADQTAMTPAARHLFYLNRPQFQDKQTFRSNCPKYEATIVIGCYLQGQRGIFVLKVDDPRLAGVEQVTAAHEMLHAAYNRLGKERASVDSQLQAYARDGLQDARIKATLKSYETTEPGEQNNEMFAIFGTEIAVLPDELEKVYARYFSDRGAVVAFANNYQAAFTSRQEQVKQHDERLNVMDAQIKTNTRTLDNRRSELSEASAQLQAYRDADDVDSYNSGVASFNQQVAAYNRLLEQTKALIEQYNKLVAERNDIAAQTNQLRQAIDSGSLPQSQKL